MNTSIELARSIVSPPGDSILEHIEFIGMTQAELAERMGRPKEKINDIIKGREPITMVTAHQLEKVLGIPASFWINREKTYRLALYQLEHRKELESQSSWLNSFPINNMKKLGWINDSKETFSLVDNLLKFFGIASPKEWENIYLNQEAIGTFNQTLAYTYNPYAISVWLRKGELQSKEIVTDQFDKIKFKEKLEGIRLKDGKSQNFSFERLQKICAESGVALVQTPNIAKAPIKAAARWIHKKPVIQLSNKFHSDNEFWMIFFHEVAHILLHGKKEIFLEATEGFTVNEAKEAEATQYAVKLMQRVKGSKHY